MTLIGFTIKQRPVSLDFESDKNTLQKPLPGKK